MPVVMRVAFCPPREEKKRGCKKIMKTEKKGARFAALSKLRASFWVNLVWSVLTPTVFFFTTEWIHRDALDGDFWHDRFLPHLWAFVLGWLLLVLLYILLSQLTGLHWLATLVTGAVSNLPGVVTRFKLEMRGEPFLPWDFTQIGDFAGVAGRVTLSPTRAMAVSAAIFAVLLAVSCFLRLPYAHAVRWRWRGAAAGVSGVLFCAVLFGVMLNPSGSAAVKIVPDMWMQDRYYKNYGVITGFLTNLQALEIDKPEDYSEETVLALAEQTQQNAANAALLWPDSYGATAEAPIQTPNIIFVMNESFWDVTRLDGITYDRELTPNLTALKEEAAYGYCFSPSFGGGTCDVEFEVLTGFSVEHLPSGCKPYQQHVTRDMFSLPQYLRAQGYDTVAVHGYYRRFWSRDTAYPNLGINTFVAAEDFSAPQLRRGFISDAEMTERIIEEYAKRAKDGPVFLHAVTMQNHTTYDASRYPEDELVQIVEHPGLSEKTISQLRDFATGVHEADAALGSLVAYLRTVDEPTILVFWGDHFNPVGEGYELYEKTGYIEQGAGVTPEMRRTDLLIWSNYSDASIPLGTIAAYDISPVMMELYGLEKPTLFQFLTESLSVMRARTRGNTVQPDGTDSPEMTEEQRACYDAHWLLQYDLMFGEPYLESYAPAEE